MLILSRKQEESIVIGDDIVLKVISIDRGSVKLGFDAPVETLILRAELKEAISSENKKASSLSPEDEKSLNALGAQISKGHKS
ncbi:carbon storage regulator [Helicobacter sp. 11S02629-2]|uniref:carbon storage regulator n=1 Tax=Helicobacter sp. 11S02629-2 TaxID=1476195 RepID=UPI000BA794F2|nr:carbon storage regulator [Helicobacter sp. 11S02629-2]PAF45432.1 carbon storage regulator [Helicobacter sp. 11S02629-2]